VSITTSVDQQQGDLFVTAQDETREAIAGIAHPLTW
jgi:hypothetical protein